MSTFDQPIRSFLTSAASSSPTPGGGSVAALVAALGASMTSMVANLTQGAKFADVEGEMKSVAENMTNFMQEAEALLEDDMQSFDRYMAALKLPKDTDEQKASRSAALQEASVKATLVPLRLAEICTQALETSHTIAETANKNVISDLGIAALLLESAAQSALLTVDMNLPGLKDPEQKTAFTNEREALADKAVKLKDEVVHTVRQRLA